MVESLPLAGGASPSMEGNFFGVFFFRVLLPDSDLSLTVGLSLVLRTGAEGLARFNLTWVASPAVFEVGIELSDFEALTLLSCGRTRPVDLGDTCATGAGTIFFTGFRPLIIELMLPEPGSAALFACSVDFFALVSGAGTGDEAVGDGDSGTTVWCMTLAAEPTSAVGEAGSGTTVWCMILLRGGAAASSVARPGGRSFEVGESGGPGDPLGAVGVCDR